jgi:2-C-methyl-D-erythritol 4-phosphate cytidylyltransferase
VFVSAIIAAGGRGLRFGGSSPKQLLTLGGRSILARSVDAFVACDVISEIVVALPADLAAAPPSYLQQRGKPVTVVSGGDQRRASVANAFARVSERAEIVVIHDAARPLVSADLIRRTVAAASETGAAIAALRAHDTVKQTDGAGAITATLPRERIYLAQTPQAFRVPVLRDALRLVGEATDEAVLAERAGEVITAVVFAPPARKHRFAALDACRLNHAVNQRASVVEIGEFNGDFARLKASGLFDFAPQRLQLREIAETDSAHRALPLPSAGEAGEGAFRAITGRCS